MAELIDRAELGPHIWVELYEGGVVWIIQDIVDDTQKQEIKLEGPAAAALLDFLRRHQGRLTRHLARKEKTHEDAMLLTPVGQRLVALVARVLKVPEEDVVPDALLVEDLDADSLGLIEFFMAVEEEFGVHITDEDAEKLTTVGETLEFLYSKDVM